MSKWLCLETADVKRLLQVMEALKQPTDAALIRKLERANKKITTASSKGKGSELQQWVCSKISTLTGIPYDQQDDQCLIHSREMGQAGVDVILRGPALTAFPYSIECKSVESIALPEYVQQAAQDSRKHPWLLVLRNRWIQAIIGEPIVVTAWTTFIERSKE